jgi:hypothetical protein
MDAEEVWRSASAGSYLSFLTWCCDKQEIKQRSAINVWITLIRVYYIRTGKRLPEVVMQQVRKVWTFPAASGERVSLMHATPQCLSKKDVITVGLVEQFQLGGHYRIY